MKTPSFLPLEAPDGPTVVLFQADDPRSDEVALLVILSLSFLIDAGYNSTHRVDLPS